MARNFYEFEHECDEMPDGVTFVKIKGSELSQFTFEHYQSRTALQQTTLYGFRYCPYCGKEVDE